MSTSHKQDLRKLFLNQRDLIHKHTEFDPQNAAKQASKQITDYLKQMSGVWGSYRPINTEFDPYLIESDNRHLTWAYPKIKKGLIEFHHPLGPQSVWQKNHLGIEEPSDISSEVISMDKLQGVFCPALAVDLKGNRLGYGKGYYDRFLSGFKGKKIALVFLVQISKQTLPTTERDVPMDCILTEVDFFNCPKNTCC